MPERAAPRHAGGDRGTLRRALVDTRDAAPRAAPAAPALVIHDRQDALVPWKQGAALAQPGPARGCSAPRASATAASSRTTRWRAPPPISSPGDSASRSSRCRRCRIRRRCTEPARRDQADIEGRTRCTWRTSRRLPGPDSSRRVRRRQEPARPRLHERNDRRPDSGPADHAAARLPAGAGRRRARGVRVRARRAALQPDRRGARGPGDDAARFGDGLLRAHAPARGHGLHHARSESEPGAGDHREDRHHPRHRARSSTLATRPRRPRPSSRTPRASSTPTPRRPASSWAESQCPPSGCAGRGIAPRRRGGRWRPASCGAAVP